MFRVRLSETGFFVVLHAVKEYTRRYRNLDRQSTHLRTQQCLGRTLEPSTLLSFTSSIDITMVVTASAETFQPVLR
jgi:hypothetical protein